MKPEQAWWQTLKARLPRLGDRLTRIENAVLAGAPDVNGCFDGEDAWIELKAPTPPARQTTAMMRRSGNHPLLESQINWFISQRQAGGIAFILLRADRNHILIDGTKHAEAFNGWTLGEMQAAALFSHTGQMKDEQWTFLRTILITAIRHHRRHRATRTEQLLRELER